MRLRPKLIILILFTLVAYVAALGRQQSLPWLIASLFSASLIIGVAWPYRLIQRLSAHRHCPERAVEGEYITLRVDVANAGWLPRFMIEIVDGLPFVGAAADSAGTTKSLLGSIGFLPGGGKRGLSVKLLCEKRGHYLLGPIGLASSFPLGLNEALVHTPHSQQTLIIYPDRFPILALPLVGAPSQIHRGGYRLWEGAGAAEFTGLREYRRGDNPRHIHWPTSARLGGLMVKEFEPLAAASLCIALDLHQPAEIGKGKHTTLEYAVRIAASIAEFACRHDIQQRFLALGRQPVRHSPGKGHFHYRQLLDSLAIARADGDKPYARLLSEIAHDCRRGETVVVLLSEPEEYHPATLRALALIKARGAHLLAVLFERDSFIAGKPMKTGGHGLHAALLELRASCIEVRRGDDLSRVFNR